MNINKRYPVQYRCQHCAQSGFSKKDGISVGQGHSMTCPSCRWGRLEKMHWNGFRYC